MMISVDTQILIWGLKRNSTKNRAHMIPKAEHLLECLSQQRAKIMIPSLVLSEFLVKYTFDERAVVLAEMQKRFFIAPFDANSASLAAQMYMDKKSWKKSRDESNSTKQCIKVDLSILATANAHRPRVFYVEDGPLLNLATHMKRFLCIEVQPLPEVPKDPQMELFD